MTEVIIIGAGIAGLACARRLADAGLQPIVFDKGRGIGGRVATRRAGDLRFDHGAPFAQAQGDDFAKVLRDLVDHGHAAQWGADTGQAWTVGTPGMSALAKGLAVGLDVRLGTQITSVVPSGTGWHLHGGAVDLLASHVVITVPAPQVPGLLGDAHPLMAQISGVEMSPELTLMAAVSGDVSGDVPTVCETVQGDPLALIIQDSSKPNRPQHAGTAWVAHAGQTFSVAHLEKDRPDIATLMLPLLCARLGVTPDQVTHAVAHRWRHSRVAKPLGQAFVHTSDPTLYLGGDWCVGPTIEDAWSSGTAIATDLLAQNYR